MLGEYIYIFVYREKPVTSKKYILHANYQLLQKGVF